MASNPFSAPSAPFFVTETSPFGPPSSCENEAPTASAMPAYHLDASEVESSAAAIEVVIRWGQDILHIEHLERPRAFSVGEENADFALPSDKLGAARAELIVLEAGLAFAMILPGTTAKIIAAGRSLSLTDAASEGIAKPADAGAYKVALVDGTRVKMERGGFELEVASVNAGRKVAGKRGGDRKAFGGQAISLAIHGAIAAAMLSFMPALASTDDGGISDDQTYMLQAALQQAEQDRLLEEKEAAKNNEADAPGNVTEKGGAEKQTPGVNTNTTAAPQAQRPRQAHVSTDEKERQLDKAAMIRDAMTFGMIDLIGIENSANHPATPWGSKASGPDSDQRVGALWGDEVGGVLPGGLDLSTTGDPSGGPFKGNFLTSLDTGGTGPGRCFGPLCGDGTSTGYLPGTYKPSGVKPPRGVPEVKGHIPPEVIQRVVRQSFGRFRGCYEMGLRTNPSLAGRVVVSFTVGRDGSVGMVSSGGDMDSAVTSCVAKQFYGLSFPAPDSGVVRVTYPIVFSPAN